MIYNLSSELSSVFINFIADAIAYKKKELFANDFAKLLVATSKGEYSESESSNFNSLSRDIMEFVDIMFIDIILFKKMFDDELIELNLYNEEDDILVDIIPEFHVKPNGYVRTEINICIHSEVYGDKMKTLRRK